MKKSITVILISICSLCFGQWGVKGQASTMIVASNKVGTTIYTKTGVDKQIGALNTQIASLQTTVNGLLITVNSQSQIIGAQSTTITQVQATIDSIMKLKLGVLGGGKVIADTTLLIQAVWDNTCKCFKPSYQ